MKLKLLVSAMAVTALVAVSSADFNTTFAETSGLSTAFRQAARSYQAYYTPAALSSVSTPVSIVGVRFKLWNGELANWPPSNITFANFKMVLAKPTAQLDIDGEFLSTTPTISSYWASSTTVYDSSLTIAANSFIDNGTSSNPYSYQLNFTNAYTYNGGSILMALTHSGYGGTPAQAFFANGSFQNGVTDAISNTTYDPTFTQGTNAFSSPYLVEFVTRPVPEPASMAVLGLGVAALLRRRRK